MNEQLHLLYVTPSVSRLIYGIFEVERNLAHQLSARGIPVDVEGLVDACTEADLPRWRPLVPSVHKVSGPQIVGYSPSFYSKLMASKANVGHIHSLWSYTTYALYKWAKARRAPYLVTPNGMLDEWALKNSKWKKDIARFVCIDKILKEASCIQVNTMAEYESVRKLGLKNPVCVVNNGVNLPDLSLSHASPWRDLSDTKGKKVLLYLSRIHHKKGVHLLLQAWKELIERNIRGSEEWHLAVVGFKFDNNAYEKELLSFIKDNGMSGRVSTLGEQHGDAMGDCYFCCDAFILPSYSEGVPIAPLNAWAYAKPVIVTSGCNIDEGYRAGAAVKVEPEPVSIREGIEALIQSPAAKREEMGRRGRELVEAKFSWNAVGEQMTEVYQWLLDGRGIPTSMVDDGSMPGR
ncbi:glycosyltransferase [Geomonas subterranea]|uniref:Glycosyltransferase n=1 Tax=Geomonas subterranea TaxID=2847989 RepID=A0ABX8LKV7_9BACT|nr:glycosyltransferase [Geomonas subterranea]QXE91546.1 glycosyltransferase [Geomonas subterranea]QXM10365.1 glycosyltransferase [Geomonas subterranea]